MSEPGCIFCRIVAGEVPAEIVQSTDDVIAFKDVNPQAPVHVQVIPRRHVRDASALTDDDGDLLAKLFAVARQVATSQQIAERGYRLVYNVGEDAANTIPHLHMHVLGGRRLGWPPG